jgi:hypothetical protein
MLIKLMLAFALVTAALAMAVSHTNNPPIIGLASGGGNLVPVW